MNKIKFRRNGVKSLICCALLLSTSCVNEIESEVSPGTIPITFSTTISKVNTKTNGSSFKTGEQIGLFAMISGTAINGNRYIDNLKLECGENNQFIPEETVFYPEGDATLDFISYYPYQKEGIAANNSSLNVAVQTNQSTNDNFSKSDFLIAKKGDIASSNNAVQLKFQHQFAKLRIELLPQDGEDIDEMLLSNPQIAISGFYIQADYDLTDNKLSNYKAKSDIVPFGIWKKEKDKLVGKELIVIPQETSSSDLSFTIDWNGKIYTCPISINSLSSNKQCVISIKALQNASNTLCGIAGEIEDWGELTQEESENSYQISSIHIAALSFKTSDIYQVHQGGQVVAEICKEYLSSASNNLASRAIVVYPVINKQAQLDKGTVLQLLDKAEKVHGGAVNWNVADNTLNYTPGESAPIEVFYIDSKGQIVTEKPEAPATVNVSSYMLRDIRGGQLKTYPIVKIGTQYWMKENLQATTYRDGNTIKKITEFGQGAGYFHSTEQDVYFYSGDVLLADNELAPEQWKVPNMKDWESLTKYINNAAILLETGKWTTNEGGYIATNETGFNAIPYGLYSVKETGTTLVNEGSSAGYWISGESKSTLADKVILLTSLKDDAQLIDSKPKSSALFVRCIKE